MDSRIKDTALKKINRNRVEIKKMQFVHSPIFDYESTDTCNFSMVLNQHPINKGDDNLKIEWERIDDWEIKKRSIKAREMKEIGLDWMKKHEDY